MLCLGLEWGDMPPGAGVGISDKIIALVMSFSFGAGHLGKSKLLRSPSSSHIHPAGHPQPATGTPKREAGAAAVTLTALRMCSVAHWDFISLDHTCKTVMSLPYLQTSRGFLFLSK